MRKMDTKNDLTARNEEKLIYLEKLKGTKVDYIRMRVWRSKRNTKRECDDCHDSPSGTMNVTSTTHPLTPQFLLSLQECAPKQISTSTFQHAQRDPESQRVPTQAFHASPDLPSIKQPHPKNHLKTQISK